MNKKFQEETKQEQGKYFLSQQLWAGRGESTINWEKAFLENKKAHWLKDKGTCNLTPLQEWSFLDVSGQKKGSLEVLFSHEPDILTLRFPKTSPVSVRLKNIQSLIN